MIRKAVKQDVPFIVKLLANDELGKQREDYRQPLPQTYYTAFGRVHQDSNQELMVLVSESDVVIGTLQLSLIPYLTYQGGIRAQIEAVRIHSDYRGQGLGEKLFTWAINRAKERGAHLVQLTTDKQRPEAVSFYKKLGFQATHEGMKLKF